MRKLSFILALVVLALVPVMPMAASPDGDLATGALTPIIPTATPAIGVDGASDNLADLPNAQVCEGVPDPQAMEEFRSDLLHLADELNELVDWLDAAAKLGGKQIPTGPKVDRQLIQGLSHEELYVLRDSFRNYAVFKYNIETLRSLVFTPEKGSGGEEGLRPSLGSFTIVPTPTPGSPGISHFGVDLNAGTGPDINIETGDIWIKNGPEGATNPRPNYPDVITCKIPGYGNRYPNWATLAATLALDAAKVAQIILNATCETLIVICPAPGGTTLPGCTAKKVGDAIVLVADKINHTINEFCVPAVDSAEIQAGFENTQILHADLDDHDKYLTARANTIDQFLFDFRNLNLRLDIEANLASPDDDPNSLFALPSNICISDDPQPGGFNVEVIGKPNDPMTDEKLNRCGLLEVVSDTVRSAIDMTSLAGQDVHNAEAEFQAAVAHFNNGEWKLAYARFRKAYREAVRP